MFDKIHVQNYRPKSWLSSSSSLFMKSFTFFKQIHSDDRKINIELKLVFEQYLNHFSVWILFRWWLSLICCFSFCEIPRWHHSTGSCIIVTAVMISVRLVPRLHLSYKPKSRNHPLWFLRKLHKRVSVLEELWTSNKLQLYSVFHAFVPKTLSFYFYFLLTSCLFSFLFLCIITVWNELKQ